MKNIKEFSMDLKKFGVLVKKLREDQNLTQGDLADILHVHRTAVNKWEKGKSMPLNDTLVLMADYFNISLDELIAGEIFRKENEHNTLLLSLLRSKRKSTLIAKHSIIFLILLFIIFLNYYFFTTYNSIHVYMLYGDNKDIKVKDSLLIVSKDIVYLKLGNIVDKNENNLNINNIVLKQDDNTIFIGDPKELLTEKRNNIELFNTKLKNKYDNLYLIINYNNKEEIIDINIEKDFQNKSLFYFFKKKTIYKEITNKSYNTDYYKINKDFVYDKDTHTYTYKKNNTEIIYYESGNICKVTLNNNTLETKYDYHFSTHIINYDKLKNGELLENYSFNVNEIDSEIEKSIYNDLKTNYLDKYFSETNV